jgi:hypothetical protein
MFNFSGTSVNFLPDDDARAWVAEGIRQHVARLGAPAQSPRLLEATGTNPRDLDDLFEMMCGVQAEIGQSDVEFSLVELGPDEKPPADYAALGDPQGHLMHTLVKDDEFAVVVVPALFRVRELVYAAVARELGRIAIHRAGGHTVDPQDVEGDAELAGVVLGMGVWLANGAYVYENACCGGGCGIDLKSVRAGLSMPEACFALALDSQRKGLSRRVALRHLEPNQRAALKSSWGHVKKAPALRAAVSDTTAALPGS